MPGAGHRAGQCAGDDGPRGRERLVHTVIPRTDRRSAAPAVPISLLTLGVRASGLARPSTRASPHLPRARLAHLPCLITYPDPPAADAPPATANDAQILSLQCQFEKMSWRVWCAHSSPSLVRPFLLSPSLPFPYTIHFLPHLRHDRSSSMAWK